MHVLGAKYGFAPSVDFIAQSLDLSFMQNSKDSAVELLSYLVLSATEYNLWYWLRRVCACLTEQTYTGLRLSTDLQT